MAFELRKLSVLSYAQGFTLWHYPSDGDDPRSRGYFADAGELIKPGDIVLTTRLGEPLMLCPNGEKMRSATEFHPLDLFDHMTRQTHDRP